MRRRAQEGVIMNNRQKKNKIKLSGSDITFYVIAYFFVGTAAVICVLPFLLIVSGSFTDNGVVMREGYSLLPKVFSLDAYATIFRNPASILQAYKMTIYYTVMGTATGLFVTTLTAYVLSRKEFKYRNVVSFLLYFTTIFGGGMIPWYLLYANVLQLKGTTFVIWFPGITGTFLIILMRTFISGSVPDAITESAKIDGAGQFTVFWRIVLPVLKPGLATVGLFLALGYWNDWYRSSLFSTSSSTYELQFYLSNMLNSTTALKDLAIGTTVSIADLPTQSVKMAMAVVVTGPVLLFYPFVQKYFVSGITIGAVKG